YAAAALIEYVREQRLTAGVVPDGHELLVETWQDELGRLNIIVHCPYGQRINRTWGVALSAAAKEAFRQRWSSTVSNDLILLTLSEKASAIRSHGDARSLLETVTAETLDGLITGAAEKSASQGAAFRDAAVCAFQVLRAWQGRRVAVWLQSYRAEQLHQAAGRTREYPITAEVVRGYLSESLDVPGTANLLRQMAEGQVRLTFRDVESPSPFAHSLLIGDRFGGGGQMGRDRRAHLLRLHRQVLQQVLSSDQMAQLLDVRAIEQLEQRSGHRSEVTRARSPEELAKAIRDLGDLPAEMSAVAEITDGDAAKMLQPLLADGRVVAIELPDDQADPIRLVAADLWRQYHDAFARGKGPRRLTVLRPRLADGQFAGFDPV
ncbi:hypothetical protein LCGC14_2938570, partial [marine sediment metagenome]